MTSVQRLAFWALVQGLGLLSLVWGNMWVILASRCAYITAVVDDLYLKQRFSPVRGARLSVIIMLLVLFRMPCCCLDILCTLEAIHKLCIIGGTCDRISLLSRTVSSVVISPLPKRCLTLLEILAAFEFLLARCGGLPHRKGSNYDWWIFVCHVFIFLIPEYIINPRHRRWYRKMGLQLGALAKANRATFGGVIYAFMDILSYLFSRVEPLYKYLIKSN